MLEAFRATFGVLAATCGDDNVDDGAGKACFQSLKQQVWIGIQRVNDRRLEIAGWHAMTVADDIHSAIGRPLVLEFRDSIGQVAARHGWGASTEGFH